MGLKKWFTPGSYQWKLWMKYLYGWGAAVVVLGALFKIQHWKGADIMIIVGMSVETFVFFMSALEPVPHEYDWTLVYPELLGEEGEGKKKKSKLKEIEDTLEKTQLTPEVFLNLEKGILSLKEQAEKMKDIGDAVLATTDYATRVKEASSKVNEITSYYEKAAKVMEPLTSLQTTDYEELSKEIQSLKENTSKINIAYQSYFKATQEQLGISTQLTQELKNYIDNIKNTFATISSIGQDVSSITTTTSSIVNEIKEVGANLASTLRSVAVAFEPLTPDKDGKVSQIRDNLNTLSEKISQIIELWGEYNKGISVAVESLKHLYENINKLQSGYANTLEQIASINEKLGKLAGEYVSTSEQVSREFSSFTDNLRKLNKIYGGILSAMTYKPE